MFSICRAIAFASNTPTQIGSTFCPSRSRRMTMGMLVTGSTIRPLMVISTNVRSFDSDVPVSTTPPLVPPPDARGDSSALKLGPADRAVKLRDGLAPQTMRSRPLNRDVYEAAEPVRAARKVDDGIPCRPPGQLPVAAAA